MAAMDKILIEYSFLGFAKNFAMKLCYLDIVSACEEEN